MACIWCELAANFLGSLNPKTSVCQLPLGRALPNVGIDDRRLQRMIREQALDRGKVFGCLDEGGERIEQHFGSTGDEEVVGQVGQKRG